MRKPRSRVALLWLVAALAFAPMPVQAEALPDVPADKPSITASLQASPPSPEAMQQQMQAMQQQMDLMQQNYSRQLQQLQKTISTLTAQISKSGVVPADPEEMPPVQNPPADATLEDIGQELIFSADDVAATPAQATLATSKTAIPQSQPGFGVGARQIFDSTTGFGNMINGGLGQSMNPDIIVAGDFLGGYATRKGPDGRNRIALRETEFGFSAAVDPFARATFLFAKSEDEEMEVEEGYATLTNLPFGLQAKIGKMRSPFGKINVIHGHDLPQTDRPDVYTNFFGEEGLIESGVAVSKLLPTPWFSSLDVQLSNGENAPLFGRNDITRPMVAGRWKNFMDLSETQSVEIGVSSAIGSRVFTKEFETSLPFNTRRLSSVHGVDFTYHWVPRDQRNAFVWQTEILAAKRENPFAGGNSMVWGGYSFAEYKLNQRWNVGVRVDYSQYPEIADTATFAIAPYINFWQSEFGRWRLEYKHTVGDGRIASNNQIWAQYSVILGLHPPHTF